VGPLATLRRPRVEATMDSGGDEMQCDEPGCHHSVPLGEEGCDSEHLEYMRQRLEDEYYTMLGTIVSNPVEAHHLPPHICRALHQSHSTSKRRSAEDSPQQSSSVKRMRPSSNTLRPVFPFQANVPSRPTPFFVEHVVSMES